MEGRNLNGHQPQIIEICPFERKQILSLYKKKGGGRKRRNLYKMRRYLADNETIFRTPLLIEYADVIMEEYSGKTHPSLWQALNAIVNDWMEREEQLWHSRQGIGKKWDKEKRSDYFENAWKFILKMCQNMVQAGTYSFGVKEIEEVFSDFDSKFLGSENREFFFSTRQLIHKMNGEEYEFIHSLFYEFFVARLLVSLQSTTFEQRKWLLADDDRNYKEFYAHWILELPARAFDTSMADGTLLQKLERSIEGYVLYDEDECGLGTPDQIGELILADSVSLNGEPDISVYGILWLFPLVGEIKWKSYQLSLPEITDLMGEIGKLSLTDGRLREVSDLQFFYPFRNLDIRNNNVTGLEQMGACGPLDSLCLYGNRLESLKPLTDIKVSKLEISVWNEKNLDELFSLSECCYFIELPEASSLYIKLEQFQRSRIHWHLAFVPKIASFRRYYGTLNCGDFTVRILKAVFQLVLRSFCTEKHFEPAAFDFGEEAGKCLYLGKKYEEALEVFGQIKSAVEKVEDVEERILLKTDGWMGQVFAKTGEYGRAIPLLKRACGKRWTETADDEKQIMWYWLMVSLYRENCKINVKDYGIHDILKAMDLWGRKLHENKQFVEAAEILSDLYQNQSSVLGENHEDTLITQLWFGATLYREKRYEEAEKELLSCYEKREEVLGAKAKDTLTAQYWLGPSLYREKKYEEAEKMSYDCYEKRKDVLGENHPDTLCAKENYEKVQELKKNA